MFPGSAQRKVSIDMGKFLSKDLQHWDAIQGGDLEWRNGCVWGEVEKEPSGTARGLDEALAAHEYV